MQADFNGDGTIDLAVAANDLRVLLGNGDGTFAAPLTFNGLLSVLTAGDFNGDGRADLAALGNGLGAGYARTLLNVSQTPTVQFSASSYSVGEHGGAAVITVTRSGDLSRPASVEYATSNLTASERADYTAAIGTLRFAAGESSKSFSVFITDDALVEGDETLALDLGNPAGLLWVASRPPR